MKDTWKSEWSPEHPVEWESADGAEKSYLTIPPPGVYDPGGSDREAGERISVTLTRFAWSQVLDALAGYEPDSTAWAPHEVDSLNVGYETIAAALYRERVR